MIASMMLQLKISKTKKRLSDTSWYTRILIITVLGLMAILSFALRSTSLSRVYGVISAELPVMTAPIKDPAYHMFEEVPAATLAKTTPVVVLTDEAFFFGDLEAFGARFSDVRNKFFIKHQEGVPNIGDLLDTMHKWLADREQTRKLQPDGLLVFLPAEEIPAPIVIQTIAGLKTSPYFRRIVLASGML